MEGSYRLKIKIGANEFEADGPAEVVQEQFRIFKELMASAPPSPPPQTQKQAEIDDQETTTAAPRTDTAVPDSALDKITRQDDRIISLTVRAKSADDAVLLLLYAQRVRRNNDAVTGAEIMNGITATGGMSVARVDKLLEKLGKEGDVIVIGERRSKRYRLTNTGLTKARQIAADLLAIVA